MSYRDEIVRRVIAAAEPPTTPVVPTPAPPAAPAPVSAEPPTPAVDYAALWKRAIEREAGAVLAHRRALGL